MLNKSRKYKINNLGIISYFVRNPVAANLLMILFIISGILSLNTMKKETFPIIDPKIIAITVPYPGGSPKEVEEGIINPIQEAILAIDGIKKISAKAKENFAIINIEAKTYYDIDDLYNNIESAINSIPRFPPKNSENPTIQKFKPSPTIMMLALYGDVTDKSLKIWSERIKEDIKQKTNLSLVKIEGLKDYEISIEISEKKLQEYKISLTEISDLINEFSQNISLGNLESKKGDIILRIQEKLFTGKELKNLIIRTDRNGAKLYLKDIANVKDNFSEKNINTIYNGKKAAIIEVRLGDSQDSIMSSKNLNKYISELSLPINLKLDIISDYTKNLKERINLILKNGIIGFMIVFLILLIFIDLKLAFWISIAIPVSMLGGIFIYSLTGQSINMVSLFGLIVVLGIVVDDAIVVGESIFEEQNIHPSNHYSVINGVRKVISPVTVGVLTTIAAFTPLIFGEGVFAQIIRVIPLIIIPILFISLIEAYFILPAHLRHNTRWNRGIIFKIRNYFKQKLYNFTQIQLTNAIEKSIKFRYLTITILICFGIFTIATIKAGHIGFVFFPQIESDRITISLTMPNGTSHQFTEKNIKIIQRAAQKVEKNLTTQQNGISPFSFIMVNSGFNISQGGGPEQTSASSSNNIAQLYIKLKSSQERRFSAKHIENMLREEIGSMPNIKNLSFRSSLVSQKNDIELELSHPDDLILTDIANKIHYKISKIDGIFNINNSVSPGKEEYIFKLNKNGLALGLTPAQIGQQLRGAFFGLEVQRIQRSNSEVKIYVKYPKKQRQSLAQIYKSRIRLKNGKETSIKDIATIKKVRSIAEINHSDGKRIALISARIEKHNINLAEIINNIKQEIITPAIEQYPELDYKFEGEKKEQDQSMMEIKRNIIIAIMIIYIILGASLKSYFQPFLILAAVPFGFFGAVWGHFIFGYPLTFISMFGVVALIGVLVNASIVFVDFFNKIRKKDFSITDSAILTVQRRFRPILLTTISTCGGLLPILFETSIQARFLVPMVISLSIGILFSTFIILFLIPSLLKIIEDIKIFTINLFIK